MVKSRLAEKKGFGVSLFEKLCKAHPEDATVLKKQYRMCNDILELSNSAIYHGAMTSGSEEVKTSKIEFTKEAK